MELFSFVAPFQPSKISIASNAGVGDVGRQADEAVGTDGCLPNLMVRGSESGAQWQAPKMRLCHCMRTSRQDS